MAGLKDVDVQAHILCFCSPECVSEWSLLRARVWSQRRPAADPARELDTAWDCRSCPKISCDRQ